MARKSLILSNSCIYHVTNRSNNREWFYLPIQQVWDIFLLILERASEMYLAEIHVFVLMSNHYHLILDTPKSNLDRFMRYFQTEVCREIQRRAGRINHVFGNRYKGSSIWSAEHYALTYKYVLRNPVKAKLCKTVESYPFNTLYELLRGNCALPTIERSDFYSEKIPREINKRLLWLNKASSSESDELIRKALRRSKFHLSEGNEVRKVYENLWVDYAILAPYPNSAEK